MSPIPLHRAIAVLPLAMVLGLLAACSGGTTATSDASKAANDKAAERFVACLTDQGQNAKIVQPRGSDQGMVGILQPTDELGDPSLSSGGSDTRGGDSVQITMFHDPDGSWLMGNSANAYPEDGGQRAAWKTCAKKVPDFTQPKANMSGGTKVTSADVAKATLAFAKCARSTGFPDFADPNSNGQLTLPSGITEDEFRALLTACVGSDASIGIGFTKESSDALDFDWVSIMNEFMGQHIQVGTGSDSTSGSK
jgi:hypothetical protein